MRRTKPEKRAIYPDIRYQNKNVQLLIHHILRRGKKSTATTVVYKTFDLMEAQAKRNPVEVYDQALKNVGPVMEVRPRRVGGATYQVPMEVEEGRRITLALRWIIDGAKARAGKSFAEKLSAELMDAANNQGAAVHKRDETHKMAEANRAFSHFRI
jgi:small subunit ribosomal protein S7